MSVEHRVGTTKMKVVIGVVFVIGFVTAVSSDAMAQWPAFALPNVPRTADGKPNLEGPTPRTPDGKPDLSGIWSARLPGGGAGQRGGAGAGQRGQGAQAASADGPQRAAGPTVPPLPPDGIPIATFGNAGQGFKDDL